MENLGLRKPAQRAFAVFMAFVLAVAMVPIVPAEANAEDEVLDESAIEQDDSSAEEVAEELCGGDDSEQYEEIVDDLEDLESVGFEPEYVESVEESDEGTTYEMESPEGAEADITVLDDEDDDLSLRIDEEDVSNTLTYADDGSLYLNGELLEIEITTGEETAEEEAAEDAEEAAEEAAEVQQSGDGGSYYTSNNPRPGKKWKYIKDLTTTGTTKLSHPLAEYGTFTVASILTFLGSELGPVINVAAWLAKIAIEANPYSHYLSVKRKVFKPLYNGHVCTWVNLKNIGKRRVQKVKFFYYSQSGCKGKWSEKVIKYWIED